MMITPLPGCPGQNLVGALAVILNNGEQVRDATTTPSELRVEFLQWFNHSRAQIQRSLSVADCERVLPMAAGWRVAASNTSDGGKHVYGLISAEFRLVLDLVEAAHESLRLTVERLKHLPGVLVVLDTSVLIQHRHKLAELVIADDIGERQTAVRMVLPMVVVDELDRLKESKDKDVRWRAAHSLGKLDELLSESAGTGPELIHPGRPRVEPPVLPVGPAYLEVLHDPRGHLRLPNEDDEIIDRAVALRDAAQGSNRLRMVTFDTGQHMRARSAGLDVTKLDRREHRAGRSETCQCVS